MMPSTSGRTRLVSYPSVGIAYPDGKGFMVLGIQLHFTQRVAGDLNRRLSGLFQRKISRRKGMVNM